MEILLIIGLFLICPITMFFMMRGHKDRPDGYKH